MDRMILSLFLVFSSTLACSSPAEKMQSNEQAAPVFQQKTQHLGPAAGPEMAEDLDSSPNILSIKLKAEAGIGENGEVVYRYNGQRPGPTIRARVGDLLRVELENALDDPTTIHWHGLKVPVEMDGVTWATAPVQPGESFVYEFTLTHPGTFWYHPHFNTKQQVDRGLYGALIVESPEDPILDQELVLLFDVADEETLSAKEGSREQGHHDLGALQTRWLVNGHEQPQFTLPGGSSARVRMINVSNVGFLKVSWPGIRQIASDQGILASLVEPESILLAPGDRADVEWLIGEDNFQLETLPYTLNGGQRWGDSTALLEVLIDSPAPSPNGASWPFSAELPTEDSGNSDIVYVFTGSDRTGQWLINGESFPDITIEKLALGSVGIIEVRNLSPTEHPFHLHGLHFEVLSIDGIPPLNRQIEDTINVKIRETLRLRVEADNPGDWMLHCHILPHADEGMMTVLRVE